MPDQHANFAYSTVATAPSPATSGTSLGVQTGDGAGLPTPPFNAVVCPANANPPRASSSEIVRVTAIVGDTLTIVRAQEGTSARTILVGDQIFAAITKKTLTDIEALISGVSTMARMYRAAATSITSAAAKVACDTTSYDPGGNISLANSRYICPNTGYYAVTAQLEFTAACAGLAVIAKNGASVAFGTQDNAAIRSVAHDVIYCQAGDYLELWGAGAAQAVYVTDSPGANYLSVVQVGGQNLVAGLSPTAQSADYTAGAGQLVLMTGAHAVTLPAAPVAGTQDAVIALTGAVTINRGGTDTITRFGTTALTSLTVPAGTYCYLVYLGGVWYVVDQSVRSPARTAARLYRNAAWNLATGINKIPFDSTSYDPGGNVVIGSSRYVAPVAGRYQVTANVVCGNGQVSAQALIYKNGALYASGEQANTTIWVASVADLVDLAAGDYVEIYVNNNSGSIAPAGGVGAANTSLSVVLMENA